MATRQMRVDDHLKTAADDLFASLGLDTSTAMRMFLVAAMEAGGIPFAVKHGAGHDVDRDSATNCVPDLYRIVFEIIDKAVWVYDIQNCRQNTDKNLV